MTNISNYNTEVELSVLNHLLLDGTFNQKIIRELNTGDFSVRKYRQIFSAINQLYKESPSNEGFIVNLSHTLAKKSDPELGIIVGKVAQGSLYYPIHSESDLDSCIRIIKARSKREKLKSQALTLANMLDNPLLSEEELNEAIQKLQPIQDDQTEEERLKLEISNYLLESDPFKKIKLKNKIHCNYRINRHDFLYLVRAMQSAQQKPEKNFLTGEEFFKLDFSANEYLVPGLIPLGDLIVFAGDAKCGKSNLVGDLTRALLEGKPFLGEQTRQSKILYGACDEALRDTQNRFLEIGIDLIPGYEDNLALLRSIELDNLQPLIDKIQKFKPQLIIIDNLTTIARNAGVAEKDVEFAHYLFELRHIAENHGCTFLILHHQNKDPLARGMKKIGGNARLLAAPSEIWQLLRQEENDYKDPRRFLDMISRTGNPRRLSIQFNSQSLWSRQGIFHFNHEVGDENGENRTNGEMILEILATGDYEVAELKELTGLSRSIYQNLDRLIRRGEIKKRRSKTNKRSWVYFLPYSQQEGGYSQNKKTSTNCTIHHPPSPSTFSLGLEEKNSKSIDMKAKTPIQHHDHTLGKIDHNQGVCDQLLNGVLNGSNNHGNSISAKLITKGKKKGGEGVQNSTNKLPNEHSSQLEFLAKQFQPGQRVVGIKSEAVIDGWQGYVLEVSESKALIVWDGRKEPMSVDLDHLSASS